jgi:hypothetical protein
MLARSSRPLSCLLRIHASSAGATPTPVRCRQLSCTPPPRRDEGVVTGKIKPRPPFSWIAPSKHEHHHWLPEKYRDWLDGLAHSWWRRGGGAAHVASSSTHSLQPPGFSTLEPIKRKTGFKPLLFQINNLHRALRLGMLARLRKDHRLSGGGREEMLVAEIERRTEELMQTYGKDSSWLDMNTSTNTNTNTTTTTTTDVAAAAAASTDVSEAAAARDKSQVLSACRTLATHRALSPWWGLYKLNAVAMASKASVSTIGVKNWFQNLPSHGWVNWHRYAADARRRKPPRSHQGGGGTS